MILRFIVCLSVLAVQHVHARPQKPEINDQFANTTTNGTEISDTPGPNIVAVAETNLTKAITLKSEDNTKSGNQNETRKYINDVPEVHGIVKLYNAIENSVITFFSSERVVIVLRNIGGCIVNGVMEIITFYLPAPMMPLIASVAGMLIPFEPVVTLRNKMPVTSYRRALNRAVNSFMGTFDKFKLDDNEDPYMTRRFNRRFMNDASNEKRRRDDVLK